MGLLPKAPWPRASSPAANMPTATAVLTIGIRWCWGARSSDRAQRRAYRDHTDLAPCRARHRLGTLARAVVTAPRSARAPETWATGLQKSVTDLSVDRANHNIAVQAMSSAFGNSSAVALANSGGRHPSRAVRPCPTGIARPHFLALLGRLRYRGRLVGPLFRARGAVLRGGRQSWQNHRQRGVGSRFLRKVCRSSPGDRVIERRRMLALMRGIKQEEITEETPTASAKFTAARSAAGSTWPPKGFGPG